MSKHKKPASEHQLQKLNQLHHKHEFMRRLKVFAKAYTGSNTALLLTEPNMNAIYQSRVHTIKLVVANNTTVEPHDKKDIESFLLNRIKAETITASDGTNVSMSDYITVGLSMYMYFDRLSKTKTPENIPFFEALNSFKEHFFDGEDINKRIYFMSVGVCALSNNLGSHSYWINPQLQFKIKDDGTALSYLELHKEFPEKKMFEVDAQPRPAFRLGWAWAPSGMTYFSLRPSEIGLNHKGIDIPLNIYIQSHALQRLSERVDCIDQGMVHYFVMVSLWMPKVILETQDKLLIEVRLDDYKIGYLKAEIVNGSILIRTFLFVTNNGTPEGKKLEEVTGLGKLDKKYLAIDKLSAFMASDIRSNEAVAQMFRKAECEYLLDLHQYLKQFTSNKLKFQNTGALLSEYLQRSIEKDLMPLTL